VELHRLVGESIDVTLNGRMIARGEVVVVDEKFAIRINEIVGNGE
jgi:flagellar motor switch protein FliN/FliY